MYRRLCAASATARIDLRCSLRLPHRIKDPLLMVPMRFFNVGHFHFRSMDGGAGVGWDHGDVGGYKVHAAE